MRELDAECERLVSGDLTHPGFYWAEGTTPDGNDGWDGFMCPRCHADQSQSHKPCARPFSTDLVAARLLEDEIERRGLQYEYVAVLWCVVGYAGHNGEGPNIWKEEWTFLRATPEQRAQAFLKAVNHDNH